MMIPWGWGIAHRYYETRTAHPAHAQSTSSSASADAQQAAAAQRGTTQETSKTPGFNDREWAEHEALRESVPWADPPIYSSAIGPHRLYYHDIPAAVSREDS